MSEKSGSSSSSGIGFWGLLTVLFIGLKLGGIIGWSWLWVLAPLWIPGAVLAAILSVCALVVLCGGLWDRARIKRKEN